MTVLLLFLGFILCVAGVIRGNARIRDWSLRSFTVVALFWSSLTGSLSAVAVLAAGLLMAATFDETRDMNPVFPQIWRVAMPTLWVSSILSLSLHLLLFLIPTHDARTKPNVA